MKPLPGLMGMVVITIAVGYIEGLSEPSDWSRAGERLIFLWFGAAVVLLPGMLSSYLEQRARRRRHRRKHRTAESAAADQE